MCLSVRRIDFDSPSTADLQYSILAGRALQFLTLTGHPSHEGSASSPSSTTPATRPCDTPAGRARTARAVPPGRESVPSRGWSFEGDHVLNRRVARLKGFSYLRIVPISRGANSSHGSLSEGWSVAYHSTPQMREINRASLASVQYADIADIAKMLNRHGTYSSAMAAGVSSICTGSTGACGPFRCRPG